MKTKGKYFAILYYIIAVAVFYFLPQMIDNMTIKFNSIIAGKIIVGIWFSVLVGLLAWLYKRAI
ncbi:MAG: hypothetical protein QMD86_00755 [Patescibacteria group bacterium]|nr:hypothetical protein [Patescibacteria group bacterium]